MTEQFSVADFGARGNGVANDTAAIQRALDAAEKNGGGVVVMPAGVYIVSGNGDPSDGALRIGSNVTLIGAGQGETIIKLADGSSQKITGIIRTESGRVTHDVTIKNLTIDGNKEHTSGEVDGFFTGVTPGDTRASHDITLDSVEIRGVSRYAFDPHEQAKRLIIVDSHAHDNGKDGFTIDYISDSVFVGNLSENNGRHGFNVVTSSHDNLLVDNIARNNAGVGLATQNGSDLRAWTQDITVVGGEYANNGLQGMLIKVSEDVTIYDAYVHDNQREGIYIAGSVRTTVVHSTTVNDSRGTAGKYLELRSSDLTGDADYVKLTGRDWAVIDTRVVSDVPESWRPTDVAATADIVVGTANDDRLVGNTSDNFLDGAGGTDTAVFAKAIECYAFIKSDSGSLIVKDLATGASSSGIDVLKNIERLEFQGHGYSIADVLNRIPQDWAPNIDLVGTDSADTLRGGAGADILNGLAGADRMEGGAGNDSYVVDNARDVVVEAIGAGTDRISTSVNFALSDNVENLVLTGTAYDGRGNALDNVVTGNDSANILRGFDGDDSLAGLGGNDTLLGGYGNDTLSGGSGANDLRGGYGDDTYLIGSSADRISEYNDQGHDTAISSFDFALSKAIEDLVLAGTAKYATGNTTANHIVGNAADNVIDGGRGADLMEGGVGDDIYYVDNAGDEVVENADAGVDRILASVSHALEANTEWLTLTGTAKTTGIGNDLANTIFGSAAANSLEGGGGNDTLNGGAGNDSLTGGTGNDIFSFSAGFGRDTIKDFQIGGDRLDFTAAGLQVSDANVRQVGADLVLDFGHSLVVTLLGVDIGQFTSEYLSS